MAAKKRSKTGDWLIGKFFIWQQKQGEIKTQGEFAEWLGVSRGTLSNWTTKGFEASGKNLDKIATKLGAEIYDILGKPRPDERLQQIVMYWSSFSEEARNKIAEEAARYITQNPADEDETQDS